MNMEKGRKECTTPGESKSKQAWATSEYENVAWIIILVCDVFSQFFFMNHNEIQKDTIRENDCESATEIRCVDILESFSE